MQTTTNHGPYANNYKFEMGGRDCGGWRGWVAVAVGGRERRGRQGQWNEREGCLLGWTGRARTMAVTHSEGDGDDGEGEDDGGGGRGGRGRWRRRTARATWTARTMVTVATRDGGECVDKVGTAMRV